MIDLNQLPGTGEATVVKVGHKRRQKDEGQFVWDIDLSEEINSPDAILAVDHQLRGAGAMIQAAEEQRYKLTLRDDAQRPDVKLIITAQDVLPLDGDSDSEQGYLVRAKAEFRYSVIRVNGRTAVRTTRWRVGGPVSARMDLIANEGELVTVRAEALQQQLPLGETSAPKVGQVVSAVAFAGVLKEVRGNDYLVVDLGETATLGVRDVQGAFDVVAPADSSVDQLLASYRRRCSRKGIAPSWRHLIGALTEAVVADEVETNDDGAYVLTTDMVDRAIAMGETAAGADHAVPMSADEAM